MSPADADPTDMMDLCGLVDQSEWPMKLIEVIGIDTVDMEEIQYWLDMEHLSFFASGFLNLTWCWTSSMVCIDFA